MKWSDMHDMLTGAKKELEKFGRVINYEWKQTSLNNNNNEYTPKDFSLHVTYLANEAPVPEVLGFKDIQVKIIRVPPEGSDLADTMKLFDRLKIKYTLDINRAGEYSLITDEGKGYTGFCMSLNFDKDNCNIVEYGVWE